jgi:hypothetical protein
MRALMSAVLCGCQLAVAVMQAPELCLAPPNRDAHHRVRARHFPHVHLLVGILYCRRMVDHPLPPLLFAAAGPSKASRCSLAFLRSVFLYHSHCPALTLTHCAGCL